MSKKPVFPALMRGTGQSLDYITIAVRGNISLGLKVDGVQMGFIDKDNMVVGIGLRIRAAAATSDFLERATGAGSWAGKGEDFATNKAFPASYTKSDEVRSSFEMSKKREFDFKLDDNGNLVCMSEKLVGQAVAEIIFGTEHIDAAVDVSGGTIVTDREQLINHIEGLLYPSYFSLWARYEQDRYKDNEKVATPLPSSADAPTVDLTSGIAAGIAAASSDWDDDDNNDGSDNDDADDNDDNSNDEADADPTQDEPQLIVPDEPADDTNVTPFPSSDSNTSSISND